MSIRGPQAREAPAAVTGAALSTIAALVGARRAHHVARLQPLWRGYGEVNRIALDGGPAPTAIVKHVRPPRDARATTSDRRKRRSYDVEVAFYRTHAVRCDEACRVARLYGAHVDEHRWLLVLEDLDAAGFAARRPDGDGRAPPPCLAWLAAFHARFLGAAPDGLWPIGTYWHLATRTDELAAIRDPALRTLAPVLDAQLAAARFQTLVHGDAKEANFCFTEDGRTVAAVDFQYVGRGCGIKDVAYLLHGHPPAALATALDRYFEHLRAALAADTDADALEAEWRALFPIAQRDLQRFLAGWRG